MGLVADIASLTVEILAQFLKIPTKSSMAFNPGIQGMVAKADEYLFEMITDEAKANIQKALGESKEVLFASKQVWPSFLRCARIYQDLQGIPH